MSPEEEVLHDLKQACISLRYILSDAAYPGQAKYAVGIENDNIAVYVNGEWLSSHRPTTWSGFHVIWYEHVEFNKKS